MGRGAGQALLAGTAVVVTGLAGLALNAATAQARWPGLLDLLRRYSWLFVLSLTLFAAILAWWQAWRERAGGDPRPPAAEPVPEWVVDREQAGQVVAAICDRSVRRRAVGITTSLHGAGGYGKTTLAHLVWAHRRVRRRFRGRVYKVTIGREVRGRAALAQKVTEVSEFITGDSRQFQDPELAGQHLGRLLDERPATLLILDDVWEEEQLAPFLMGGSPCVRLITTRNPNLLSADMPAVRVDRMSEAQARAVLTWQLPGLPDELVRDLLEATGGWALLLRLTNRTIAEQAETGAAPAAVAAHALERLRTFGPAAGERDPSEPDLNDPQRRSRAVRATVEAATALLPEGGAERFAELAVFAEDEPVPIALVIRLWQTTAGLEETAARDLCLALHRLSLVGVRAEHGGRLTLHDVIRDYLRVQLGERRLAELHGRFVDGCAELLPAAPSLGPGGAGADRAWWRTEHGYLLDHLIEHLQDAGRTDGAEAVASDLRWVEARLLQHGPTAPWSDLARIGSLETTELARDLSRIAHLLMPVEPPQALAGVLYNRLDQLPRWREQIAGQYDAPDASPAFLANLLPLPDLHSPALVRTLAGPVHGNLGSMELSPDGTWLATVDYRQPVRIWDTATGACIATLPGGAESVVISPDGTWLATVTRDDRIVGRDIPVRIWDAASGRCVAELSGSANLSGEVVISPCGTRIAAAVRVRGVGQPVHVWDRATGECILRLGGRSGAARCLAFSPDGTWLAAGGDDKAVRIWDAVTGECTGVLIGHTSALRTVMISSCGTWLASADISGAVRTWNRADGRCMAILRDDERREKPVVVSPDGTWLATIHTNSVDIWDPVTGRRIGRLVGHTGRVGSVAVSPDSTWLATTGADGTLRTWDKATGVCTAALDLDGAAASVAISPDGTWLAAYEYSGTRIWDPEAARRAVAAESERALWVRSVAFAPDGTWLVTTHGSRTMKIWNPVTGECTDTWTAAAGSVESVAVSPDGTWLAVGMTEPNGYGQHHLVRRWDLDTRQCTADIGGHAESVDSVVISPDGTWLAAGGSRSSRPDAWDLAGGRRIDWLYYGARAGATSELAISPCGTWLAAGGVDGAVRILNRAGRDCIAVLSGHTNPVTSVAISPDGTWLAAGSEDGAVRLWNWTRRRIAVLSGHTESVTSLAVSPDGSYLATTSKDGTTRIWDPETEQTIALTRTEKPLFSCAWAPDSRVLAVGGESGLYLYALQLARPSA
ncbi:NB-ARC domain-containing protein [Streptomyces sp. Agncl-13]|uniref:NB-ARC domain-containing protein n=1 Tax=Streptomyces sp. Agncl-13 TaxID=3400628 RepID=UPI003A89E830